MKLTESTAKWLAAILIVGVFILMLDFYSNLYVLFKGSQCGSH